MQRRPRRINVCFHGIGQPQRTLEPGEDRYWITKDSFRRILDVLAERPEVHISFDDSNDSDLVHALPELVDRGLRATYFVLAGRFGAAGSLDEDDVRELAGHGMSIGSHGMDHRSWRGMDADAADREFVEARERIGAVIGRPITEAAVPRGQYDRTALRRLRESGYEHVHTSDRRHASAGAWLQPRFSVVDTDTVETVRRNVLAPQPTLRRVERAAVGVIKRLR